MTPFVEMKIFMTLVALGLLIPLCSGEGGGDDSGTSWGCSCYAFLPPNKLSA